MASLSTLVCCTLCLMMEFIFLRWNCNVDVVTVASSFPDASLPNVSTPVISCSDLPLNVHWPVIPNRVIIQVQCLRQKYSCQFYEQLLPLYVEIMLQAWNVLLSLQYGTILSYSPDIFFECDVLLHTLTESVHRVLYTYVEKRYWLFHIPSD